MDLQLATVNELEVKDFQPQEQTMLDQVKSFQVTDAGSMDCAGIILNSIKVMLDKRDAVFDPIIKANFEAKQKAEKARKVAADTKDAHCKILNECKENLLGKIRTFRAEEQRRADEIARQEQARLRKIEEDKKLAEAARLEAVALELKKTSPDTAKKMQEEAARVLDEPIVTEVVRSVEVAKPAGYIEKRYQRARVVNRNILDPMYQTKCPKCDSIVPNMVLLNSLASASKGKVEAPAGVEYYEDVRPY